MDYPEIPGYTLNRNAKFNDYRDSDEGLPAYTETPGFYDQPIPKSVNDYPDWLKEDIVNQMRRLYTPNKPDSNAQKAPPRPPRPQGFGYGGYSQQFNGSSGYTGCRATSAHTRREQEKNAKKKKQIK